MTDYYYADDGDYDYENEVVSLGTTRLNAAHRRLYKLVQGYRRQDRFYFVEGRIIVDIPVDFSLVDEVILVGPEYKDPPFDFYIKTFVYTSPTMDMPDGRYSVLSGAFKDGKFIFPVRSPNRPNLRDHVDKIRIILDAKDLERTEFVRLGEVEFYEHATKTRSYI